MIASRTNQKFLVPRLGKALVVAAMKAVKGLGAFCTDTWIEGTTVDAFARRTGVGAGQGTVTGGTGKAVKGCLGP